MTIVLLMGAATAFAPMARLSHAHRSAPTVAMQAVVESVDSEIAADDVLESLLEVGAPAGMRRKMAEGLGPHTGVGVRGEQTTENRDF